MLATEARADNYITVVVIQRYVVIGVPPCVDGWYVLCNNSSCPGSEGKSVLYHSGRTDKWMTIKPSHGNISIWAQHLLLQQLHMATT